MANNLPGLGGRLPNPAQIQKYLKDVDYPASKKDIIDAAQREHADPLVMQALNDIPEGKFQTPADVSQAIGKIE